MISVSICILSIKFKPYNWQQSDRTLGPCPKTLHPFIQNVPIQHTNYHQLYVCQVMCAPTCLQVWEEPTPCLLLHDLHENTTFYSHSPHMESMLMYLICPNTVFFSTCKRSIVNTFLTAYLMLSRVISETRWITLPYSTSLKLPLYFRAVWRSVGGGNNGVLTLLPDTFWY